MSNTGRRLRENNEEILKYINQLREQRNELGFLVEKQKTEKAKLEEEMARISYKLGLIDKSLGQRTRALKLYDTTIMEVEAKYKGLADSTQGLLTHVKKESSTLENSIDKRIGTETECKNCPRCDLLPQVQTRSQGALNEIPTKQPIESEKKNTKIEYKGPSHTEEDARNLSNNPIYSRAMEYPMMLSPMINKEHMEQIKEKLTNDNVKSVMSLPKNSSNNENMKIQEGSSTSPHRMSNTIINESQSQKDSELEYSESTIASGNFIDGDFPDMQPSRETTINSAVPREFKFIEITSVESPVQSSLDDTQNTTQTENEEKEKLTIQEYDEVIDDNESGIQSKRSTTKNGKKITSSVDVFRQAYKTQHEFQEKPQSLCC